MGLHCGSPVNSFRLGLVGNKTGLDPSMHSSCSVIPRGNNPRCEILGRVENEFSFAQNSQKTDTQRTRWFSKKGLHRTW